MSSSLQRSLSFPVLKRLLKSVWGSEGSVLSHFSCVWLCVIPRTVARQAPLSMGSSRQEHWSGLPRPPPGGLLHPRISYVSCIGRWILYHQCCLESPSWGRVSAQPCPPNLHDSGSASQPQSHLPARRSPLLRQGLSPVLSSVAARGAGSLLWPGPASQGKEPLRPRARGPL